MGYIYNWFTTWELWHFFLFATATTLQGSYKASFSLFEFNSWGIVPRVTQTALTKAEHFRPDICSCRFMICSFSCIWKILSTVCCLGLLFGANIVSSLAAILHIELHSYMINRHSFISQSLLTVRRKIKNSNKF